MVVHCWFQVGYFKFFLKKKKGQSFILQCAFTLMFLLLWKIFTIGTVKTMLGLLCEIWLTIFIFRAITFFGLNKVPVKLIQWIYIKWGWRPFLGTVEATFQFCFKKILYQVGLMRWHSILGKYQIITFSNLLTGNNSWRKCRQDWQTDRSWNCRLTGTARVKLFSSCQTVFLIIWILL